MVAANNVLSGSVLFAVVAACSKGLSLLTQVVLGWYLSAEEFGIYAIALSFAAWGLAFRNGGSDQYLIQKAAEFDHYAPRILSYSLFFNVCALLVMLSLGAWGSHHYQQNALWWMMLIIGVAQIATSPAALMRAYLTSRRHYHALSVAALCADSARQVGIMVLACVGFGAFAFVWPMVLEPLVSALVIWCLVRFVPAFQRITWPEFKAVLTDTRWLMLGNLAVALSMTAIYFVLGFMLSTAELGIVFFALQLVVALSAPLNHTLNTVFFAHLSHLTAQSERVRLLSQALRFSLGLALLLGMLVFVVAEPAVRWLWGARWEAAIPLLELSAMCLPGMVLQAVVIACLSSMAKWRLRLFFLFGGVLADVLVVTTVFSLAGLEAAVMALAWARLIWAGCGVAVLSVRTDSRPAMPGLRAFVIPLIGFLLVLPYAQNGHADLLRGIGYLLIVYCLASLLFAWKRRSHV